MILGDFCDTVALDWNFIFNWKGWKGCPSFSALFPPSNLFSSVKSFLPSNLFLPSDLIQKHCFFSSASLPFCTARTRTHVIFANYQNFKHKFRLPIADRFSCCMISKNHKIDVFFKVWWMITLFCRKIEYCWIFAFCLLIFWTKKCASADFYAFCISGWLQ